MAIRRYNLTGDISEVFEECKRIATSPNDNVSNDYISNYMSARFSDQKTAIERTINDLAKRTGLLDYIHQINAIAKEMPTSLLEFEEIKKSIDDVLFAERDKTYVDILNKLQDLVSVDDRIPSELKSVFNDKKLIEYIKNNLKASDEQVIYNLRDDHLDVGNTDQRSQTYFNFTPDEHEYK